TLPWITIIGNRSFGKYFYHKVEYRKNRKQKKEELDKKENRVTARGVCLASGTACTLK
ncbi:MAG: hypothetical protein ACI90V_011947, partial [Bacillariaceae sp.]